MAEPVRGIGYDAGVLYEKDFESNPFFTEQRARREVRTCRRRPGRRRCCGAGCAMASSRRGACCATSWRVPSSSRAKRTVTNSTGQRFESGQPRVRRAGYLSNRDVLADDVRVVEQIQ